jgi:hypothetical protein
MIEGFRTCSRSRSPNASAPHVDVLFLVNLWASFHFGALIVIIYYHFIAIVPYQISLLYEHLSGLYVVCFIIFT